MQRITWWMTMAGLVLGLTVWLGVGFLGCCGKHTQRDYGRSVTHNIAAQLVNPNAGQQPWVSRGQTPTAAVNAYDKYNKSFKAEKKTPLLPLMGGTETK